MGDRVTAAAHDANSGNSSGNEVIEYAQPYCSFVSYYQQEKAAKA